ncbi:protein transport protein sec31 [Drosophila madeirensis]|uniref:Protein transport protein sec31 n=1 Tax=Drosophila madeirensis TaxID=30013 RepID=A0AAU9FLE5_DROMD|nr:protein transport protein sec31 [Drosophila subobscura]
MAHKFTCSLLLLAAVASVALAEPARFRSRSSRFQLARQEEAPQDSADPSLDVAPTPASAPYPAAGVTPEVPFDLPTETEAQPDLTYGPPAEPDNTYGPPAEPDNTYGPPADAAPADQDQLDDSLAAEPIPASLIQPRNGRLRSRRPVPEKFRSAQIIRSRPVMVYTI